jgi:thiol-disulfide isomerase/thioredoxin
MVLDEGVAKILDNRASQDDDDEDALIAELEEDDDVAFTALRERRLEQLHSEISRAKTMKETSHGTYSEIKDEKELMGITTSTKLCVVHFMKPDFNRCRIMDEKLRGLTSKHFDTRFVSINVENASFLVVKLGIQVLPCVISFIDGVGVDRITGFEGIGYKPDSFTASELEARLLASGVLVRAKMTKVDDRRKVVAKQKEEDYDDDDWD